MRKEKRRKIYFSVDILTTAQKNSKKGNDKMIMTPKKGVICMKEKKEGRDSMVYDLADIQKLLKIGRTASYDFIAKVYKEGRPFPVLKIGSMYRIPKERFDMWLSGK